MQHVIIGTAGHIDHGKTTLIKALTGRDTDTLKEEKERGISINLGFTYFDLPSGKRAGIVDVPGHERFIKNMLAGVTGIDIVLLVIAADEGVMPQTKEHLNILNLLDIKRGIVVITKKDLVDKEWLNMVIEDVKKEIENTFLKDAPIIPISSYTGEGLQELVYMIDKLTMEMEDRDTLTDFRLPIDRVFTVSGFGTVVTGTLISGTINEGDICKIYPKDIITKVRGLQVHEKPVKTAYAGQRVAVNLANVKKEDIERGDVLAKPDSMQVSMMIDCRLNYLSDAPYPLENRDRIRVYHGTSEILGRVYILDKEIVNPGETALIQIRLESPIAAKRGDKYIIRTYSPMITVGGGTILDPNPLKHKPFDKKVIEDLILKEKGDPREIIEHTIKVNSKEFLGLKDIIRISGKNYSNLNEILDELIKDKKVIKLDIGEDSAFIHYTYLIEIKNKVKDFLIEYHKNNPLKFGITKEELKTRIFGKDLKQKIYDKVLELLSCDTIKINGIYISLIDFELKFSSKQEKIKQEILKIFKDAKFQPPKPQDVIKGFTKDELEAQRVFEALVDLGMLIKINEEIFLTAENFEVAKEMLVEFINKEGYITAAQYRDMIGSSRKYAVAILEYFDSIKLTKRVEDKRYLI